MSRSRGILVQTPSGMRLLTGDRESVRSLEIDYHGNGERTPAVLDVLGSVSRLNWNLVLAPSAGATLTASLAADVLAGAHRRITSANVGFVLEEYLPWSAEDFTSRFASVGQQPFGLAIRTDDWEPLLYQLRGEGHNIAAIVPVALLQREAISQQLQAESAKAWVFRNQEGVHYVTLDEGDVTDWRFWPSDGRSAHESDSALLAAEVSLAAPAQPIAVVGADPEIVAALDIAGLETNVHALDEMSTDELLWQGAQPYWIRPNTSLNLSVGRLAGSTPIDSVVDTSRLLLTALMILLLVASFGFGWKGYQLQDMVGESQQEQIDLYRATFPGAPVPLAVTSRFDSQHRGIVGQRGGTGQVRFPRSVLTGLKSVLTAHQAPLRSRFQEIAIADDLVEIECEFRSHEEASRMVEILEQTGLAVEPPQLQKLDDKRIGTRLRGRLRSDSDPTEDR